MTEIVVKNSAVCTDSKMDIENKFTELLLQDSFTDTKLLHSKDRKWSLSKLELPDEFHQAIHEDEGKSSK